jgi:hypothetical protein
MAIVIRGKSTCVICGKILQEGQELVCFSPFVGNELDPLWEFSDAACHEICFREDPRAKEAQSRYEELRSRTSPGNRSCVVCKQQIMDPDDYFSLAHLTDDPENGLYRFNYKQAHRSCLPRWSELSQVLDLLKALKASETWRGPALDYWISELEEARRRVA